MLAELAVKAGYPVVALDYFGDADLQALCPSRSLRRDYHQKYSAPALVDAAADLDARYVIFGASLENHPAEVARLARGRRLLGNSPDTLARVRNPRLLAESVRGGGFAFPSTLLPEAGLSPDAARSWLWKPRRSGGGHGIRPWRGEAVDQDSLWQERIPGMAGSAVFVANGQRAILLGLTEQLIGRRAFGATGFGYCGNLVPPRLPPAELAVLLKQTEVLVTHLTQTFGLWGLNGLDFIWRRGQAWTLEVNPRPSASLELIQLAYGLPVFEAHVRAFRGALPDFELRQALDRGSAAGKAIFYAPHDLQVGDTSRWLAQGIRDVPHPGEQIKHQHPVCTLLTTGPTPTACLRRLWSRAAKLKRELRRFEV
jgi:predicted ATP-grasp superfamily ATP-dependent carboligase